MGGALVGLLVYEFGVYVWHRTMHNSTVLWRLFHQMHHSAERVDTFGAFWFSPLDIAGWTLLASLALTLVVGITAEATTRRAAGRRRCCGLPARQRAHATVAGLPGPASRVAFASPRARRARIATTRTCRCSTCCWVLSITLANLRRSWASTTAPPRASSTCCWPATCPRRRARAHRRAPPDRKPSPISKFP